MLCISGNAAALVINIRKGLKTPNLALTRRMSVAAMEEKGLNDTPHKVVDDCLHYEKHRNAYSWAQHATQSGTPLTQPQAEHR